MDELSETLIALERSALAALQRILALPCGAWDAELERLSLEDPRLAARVAALLEHVDESASAIDGPALHPGALANLADLAQRAMAAPDHGEAPEFIGPYRVLHTLGRGGMGVVYAAEDGALERIVAIKVIRADAVSERSIERLRYEALALARLKHPNIASIIDSKWTDIDGAGLPYIVMEHVEGIDLGQHVREHCMSRREIVALLESLAQTIHSAHQRNVVHRDLKPANVRVTPDGEIKVLDFGVARLTTRDAAQGSVDAPGWIVGTPAYMSPEQSSGPSDDVRGDVYSIGALAMELLFGCLPVDVAGLAPPEAIQRVRARSGSAITHLAHEADRDLVAIVEKAVAPDIDGRYASSDALACDLQRWSRGEPVDARLISARERMLKLSRRHKGTVAAAAGVLASLVIGIITVSWLAHSARVEATRSKRMLSFLQDVFRPAEDPRSNGDELPVTHLLESAASELQEAFPDDLETRAELADTLGMAFFQNGRFDEAERLVSSAVEWLEGSAGPGAESTLLALYDHGVILKEIGRAKEAEQCLRASAVGLTARLGAVHPRTVRSQYWLGHVLIDLERLTEAENVFRTLETQAVLAPESDPARKLAIRKSLALIWRRTGRTQSAAETLRRVVVEERRLFGDRSTELYDSIGNLAGLLAEMGEFDEALRLARECLAGYERLRGPRHPTTEGTRLNLASLLRQSGRGVDPAEPMTPSASEHIDSGAALTALTNGAAAERTPTTEQQQGGTLSGVQCALMIYAATVDAKRGEFAKVRVAIDRVALSLDRSGGNARLRRGCRALRAGLEFETGDRADAILQMRAVLADLSEIGANESVESFGYRSVLGGYLSRIGDHSGALAETRDAYFGIVGELGEESPFTLLMAAPRVHALRGAGRVDEAVRLGQSALDAIEDLLGPEHDNTTTVRVAHGQALAAAGRIEEARTELQRASDALLERHGPKAPALGRVNAQLRALK